MKFHSIAVFSASLALMPGLYPAGQAVAGESSSLTGELTEFYEAMDGDNWRNNDGWLDPDIEVCDWYGIRCLSGTLTGIRLPGNDLTGNLHETNVFDIPARHLDLGNNRIAGQLSELPIWLEDLDLSGNQLTGALPDAPDANHTLWFLDLSGNEFEGEVPGNWESIIWMDLSNNRLEGFPEALFSNIRWPSATRYLNLADNRFSGALPTSIMDIPFAHHNSSSRWGGGLNLCWNDWSIPESVQFHDWLQDHHVGGEFEGCLGRERKELDPGISGSWFNPARDGEGISLMLLDNGTPLVYWFTHISHGRQMWLLDAGQNAGTTMLMPRMSRTRGHFGPELEDQPISITEKAELRLDRVGPDTLHGEYRVHYEMGDWSEIVILHPGRTIDRRGDHARLTELAGSTCDNQSPWQWLSGAWYNPEFDGEGFLIEVMPAGRALVYWFTYAADDSRRQAWMIGEATVESAMQTNPASAPGTPSALIHIDDLVQPVNTTSDYPFETGPVESVHWGTLTLEFHDDLSGHIHYDSVFEDYGTGDYPIERLARPMLAECDPEE